MFKFDLMTEQYSVAIFLAPAESTPFVWGVLACIAWMFIKTKVKGWIKKR